MAEPTPRDPPTAEPTWRATTAVPTAEPDDRWHHGPGAHAAAWAFGVTASRGGRCRHVRARPLGTYAAPDACRRPPRRPPRPVRRGLRRRARVAARAARALPARRQERPHPRRP